MVEITQHQIEEFRRVGAVCIRKVFSQYWLDKVAAAVTKVRENSSIWSEELKAEGGTGRYFNDYCQWRRIPEMTEFVYKSNAAEIVGKLLQSQEVAFYHEHTLIKDAGTNKKTPWHVDQTYYPINGDKACSIWMPLDPVSEETTIEFVSGSHLSNKLYRARKFATSNNYPLKDGGDDQEYVDVPDIDAERHNYQIVKWKVEPGDIIVFHMKTLHGAPENMQPLSRRVFSTRWLGDDCVIASRPWTTSPPTTGGLAAGAKAMCEEFPRVWSAAKGQLHVAVNGS